MNRLDGFDRCGNHWEDQPEYAGARCGFCGDAFDPAASDARHFARFCSRECELEVGVDWPWCDACLSWHHPNNPTCRRVKHA